MSTFQIGVSFSATLLSLRLIVCLAYVITCLAITYLIGCHYALLTGHPGLERTKAKRPYYLCNTCFAELKRKTQRLVYTGKTQNALKTETVKLWPQNTKTETRKNQNQYHQKAEPRS